MISGKSTFINYLANFFYDGSLKKLHVIIPNKFNRKPTLPGYQHHESNLADTTKSQTTECDAYTFEQHNVIWNFIDTPGISDTSGYIEDNNNVDKIFSKIRSLEYLSGIILLLNGTVSRLTTNVKNVLYRFKQQLPDKVYSSMIVIYTNIHDYSFSGERDMKWLGLPSSCQCFFMQNSAFSLDPTQRQPKEIKELTEDFKESMQTLKIILAKLLSLEPVLTSAFMDMDNDRNRIRGVLHEARLIVQQLQQMENELAVLELNSSSLGSNIRKKELMLEDIATKYVRVLEEVPTQYHNTLCINCNQVCHENCNVYETYRQGDQLLRDCSALINTIITSENF
jgi:hypothetical protein